MNLFSGADVRANATVKLAVSPGASVKVDGATVASIPLSETAADAGARLLVDVRHPPGHRLRAAMRSPIAIDARFMSLRSVE